MVWDWITDWGSKTDLRCWIVVIGINLAFLVLALIILFITAWVLLPFLFT